MGDGESAECHHAGIIGQGLKSPRFPVERSFRCLAKNKAGLRQGRHESSVAVATGISATHCTRKDTVGMLH